MVDTTSGDAVADEILAGHKAWVDGLEVTGTRPPAILRKTGQTTSYESGDDGDYESGVDWPVPRFTEGTGSASNCVTDHLTGLMWLKNPDSTVRDWTTAIAYCEALDGNDGRGGYTDWRLPNVNELLSLVDYGQSSNPVIPSGSPFINVKSYYYWTSTVRAASTDAAWNVHFMDGSMRPFGSQTQEYNVWPVRDVQ